MSQLDAADIAKLRLLRRMINISLISLVVGAVINILGGVLDAVAGVSVALATALVTLYCYRQANLQSTATSRTYFIWRYVPTILFLVGPMAWSLFASSEDGWSFAEWVQGFEVIASYLLPIAFLYYVDRSLKRMLAPAESAAESATPLGI